MLTNALRSFAVEFGLIVGPGAWNISKLRELLHTASSEVFPEIARGTTQPLFAQLDEHGRRIETLEKQIMALREHFCWRLSHPLAPNRKTMWHRCSPVTG